MRKLCFRVSSWHGGEAGAGVGRTGESEGLQSHVAADAAGAGGGPGRRTYPGAVAEEEDHARQDVVHPGQDVGLGLGRHLTVGQEDGAAGPLPLQVLGGPALGGADEARQGLMDPSSGGAVMGGTPGPSEVLEALRVAGFSLPE